MEQPLFPAFKPLELADRARLNAALRAHAPRTSELNFTNLFVWRQYFQTHWCLAEDWLLILFAGHKDGACALEPVGPAGRVAIVGQLLDWLASDTVSPHPRLERVGQGLVDELAGVAGISCVSTRDHHDYVYRASDLRELRGKRYHAKRNHINRFQRSVEYVYRPYAPDLRDECLALAELWCGVRTCEEDMSLSGEWEAVRELLAHAEALELTGAVIQVDGKVQAFCLADQLNADTAVIHVEKANPEYPELYAVINQQFAQHGLGPVDWINREQDLGEAGLRKAKSSYHPAHLEPKFRVERSREASGATGTDR
jgi:hypothetical protein